MELAGAEVSGRALQITMIIMMMTIMQISIMMNFMTPGGKVTVGNMLGNDDDDDVENDDDDDDDDDNDCYQIYLEVALQLLFL